MAGFLLNRWRRGKRPESQKKPAEPLSDERIMAGYRMNWTKTVVVWDAARRATIAARAEAVIASGGFENNALERRFHVEGLDDQAHSGASLLALTEVIRALDKFERNNDNQP